MLSLLSGRESYNHCPEEQRVKHQNFIIWIVSIKKKKNKQSREFVTSLHVQYFMWQYPEASDVLVLKLRETNGSS